MRAAWSRLREQLERLGGILTLRPSQFARILTGLGVTVDAVYQQDHTAEQRGAFTDRSLVFRIRAKGAAGATERRTDAVVTFDSGQMQQETSELGRLLHWRAE